VILLDTTVLSYAVGGEHPLREPCRRLLAAHGAGTVDAATTVEAIQEFTHIQSRRRERREAAALARDYVASLQLLQSTPADLDLGLRLFERHPALGMFDAMLAAVALNLGAHALISADGGFATVPGLPWIDPATPALEALLR
jgi:predicted nucleic acid-binding protein